MENGGLAVNAEQLCLYDNQAASKFAHIFKFKSPSKNFFSLSLGLFTRNYNIKTINRTRVKYAHTFDD